MIIIHPKSGQWPTPHLPLLHGHNMQNENKLPLFIRHMLMDVAGLTLVALGVARLQVNVEFLPQALRFPYYDRIFVLLGIAMILPTVIAVYKYARNSKAE